jgi:Family of unknown function (DUF6245)
LVSAASFTGPAGAGSVPGVTRAEDKPAQSVTVEQIGAALAALGCYDGSNTAAEHAAEAARLGGAEAYRVRLVNALLGAVQTQAMLADAVDLYEQARHAAWREQLTSAGALDDPLVRVGFLRWQVLRAGTPLRLIAQNPETGPIPVAAAHAAEGLHVLLGGDRRQLPGRRRRRCRDPRRAGRGAASGPGLVASRDRQHRHPAGHAQVGRPVEVPNTTAAACDI